MMPALESWLDDLSRASARRAITVAITGNGVDAVRTHTRELGVDFVALPGNRTKAKRHGVVVMAVDPADARRESRPDARLDRQVQTRAEHAARSDRRASEEADRIFDHRGDDPDTPIGAAVAALGQLRDFGGRGIVLIDAVKQ